MSLAQNPKRVSNSSDGIVIETQSGTTLSLRFGDWIEFQTWKGDVQVGKVEGFQTNAFVFVKVWNTYTNMFNNTEAQIALNTNIPKYNADGFWTTISLLPATITEDTIRAFLQTRQDEKDRSIHKTKLTAVNQEYDTLPPNIVPGYPGGIEFQNAKKRFESKKAGKRKLRRKTKRTLHRRRK
jgi:hypothetical protein